MALGKVTVGTTATGAPTFKEPEGIGLFIGKVTSGQRALKAIGPQTDLDALFGTEENLAKALKNARLNGGPNWKAWAIGHINKVASLDEAAAVDKTGGKTGLPATGHGLPVGSQVTIAGTTNYDGTVAIEPETTVDEIVITATYAAETIGAGATATVDEDWQDVIDLALPGCDPEFIVVSKPITAGTALTDLQTRAVALLVLYRRMFIIAAWRGYLPGTDADWSAYLTASNAITTGIDAARVLVVPQVFGNELGALAGRVQKVLDEPTPRISRSPMRVESGSVVSPGTAKESIKDDTGQALQLSTLETLDGSASAFFSGTRAAKASTLPTAICWRRPDPLWM